MNGIDSKKILIKRNWHSYSKSCLIENIKFDADLNAMDVQAQWNYIENVIINAVDLAAPLMSSSNYSKRKNCIPTLVKNKLNKRKRLLRQSKQNNDNVNFTEIRTLNKEIKDYFEGVKVSSIRRVGLGTGADLWKAVRIAKNIVTSDLTVVYFDQLSGACSTRKMVET